MLFSKKINLDPFLKSTKIQEMCQVEESNKFVGFSDHPHSYSLTSNSRLFGNQPNEEKSYLNIWSGMVAADICDQILIERNNLKEKGDLESLKNIRERLKNVVLPPSFISSSASSSFKQFSGRDAVIGPFLKSNGLRNKSLKLNTNFYTPSMLFNRSLFRLYGLGSQWDEK